MCKTAQRRRDLGCSPGVREAHALDATIASLTTRETQVSTGGVGTEATVICRAAGTTRLEASYAGRTAVADLTVRVLLLGTGLAALARAIRKRRSDFNQKQPLVPK